jgi:prepilin-type N-terminal cleavage/methylation domain-containing protein
MTISSYFRRPRRGLTLIELLVVAFILVLFVAVAAPLLKPATADRKVREAARQLNAYIAEAKAFAAQRGRPVGLAFDRVAATGEAARNGNIVTRLFLAESPPHYFGDMNGATVTVTPIRRDPDPMDSTIFNVTQLRQPPWYDYLVVTMSGTTPEPALPTPPAPTPFVPVSSTVIETFPPQINNSKANWFSLDFPLPTSGMLRAIIAAQMPRQPAHQFVPFRIRFNGKGGYYDGYAEYSGAQPPSPSGTFRFVCWSVFGQPLSGGVATYEIEFYPELSSDSPLELPTGTVVDLQFSGFGQSGNQFNATAPFPLVLMFSPSGDVEKVIDNGTMTNQLSRIHFLVGTLNKAVDSSTSGGVNMPISNIADPACQWVSLNTRTGHVTTADNLTPTDFSSVNAAILQARGFATGLNTKGGR